MSDVQSDELSDVLRHVSLISETGPKVCEQQSTYDAAEIQLAFLGRGRLSVFPCIPAGITFHVKAPVQPHSKRGPWPPPPGWVDISIMRPDHNPSE